MVKGDLYTSIYVHSDELDVSEKAGQYPMVSPNIAIEKK